MKRNFWLIVIMGIIVILKGCQTSQIYTYVDASSIPDQTYDVTVYDGPEPASYALLFDIPDDGTEVFMKDSAFAEKTGSNSSRGYVEDFRARIKGHRTLTISDQDGTVKAYLMVSNLLNYQIIPVDERIMVTIEDPYHGYLQSGP